MRSEESKREKLRPKGGHESEVKAQGRHESEVKAQGGQQEDANSVHDESHVSNRHMTWWQRSWWVRIENGPHLRTARGRRRAWRAATRAAREMRVSEEAQRDSGEAERGEREKWEQGRKKKRRKQHPTRGLPLPNRKRNTSQQQQQQRRQVSRSIMTSTQNTNMKERIWIERVANEIAFQPFSPAIGFSLHNEHADAALEEPVLPIESFQRDVADGMRQHLNRVQPVIGLNFHLSLLENVLSGFRVHSQVRGVGYD